MDHKTKLVDCLRLTPSRYAVPLAAHREGPEMHMDKATEFQKTRSIYLNAVLRGDLQDLRVRVASRFKRRTVFRSFL